MTNHIKTLNFIGKFLNIIVLLCSLVIFLIISIETLNIKTNISESMFLKAQMIICIIFLFDFVYMLYLSDNKPKYIMHNWLFALISIPFLNIFHWFSLPIGHYMKITLHAILLIRGGWGMVIMVKWFTKSKVANLFYSYSVIMIAMTYFASLVFYSLEKNINPQLQTFADAAWWACMDVTTVGSNISPVTLEGRIIAVLLAIVGMSAFPILTAYITNKFHINIQIGSPKSSK